MASLPLARRRLGEILVDAKVLAPEPLAEALHRQQESGRRLGDVLVEMGVLDQHTVVAALGAQLGLPVADLRHHAPDPDAVHVVPEDVARRLIALPVRRTAGGLEVAVADPLDQPALAELERVAGVEVRLLVAPEDEVLGAIEQWYRSEPRSRGATADPPPARREPGLLDAVLAEAVDAGAGTIHLEVERGGGRIRHRVDGQLQPARPLSGETGSALLKELVGLTHPRGGRRGKAGKAAFDRRVAGRRLRVEVTTALTTTGETAVLTVVDPAGACLSLEQLGLPGVVHEQLARLLAADSGLIVLSGTPGSGRTTTLYAVLDSLDRDTRAVATVEDHPRSALPGVRQLRLAGVEGLHAAMAQDVDVIAVDEIRDPEAAAAAVEAARTGHLVIAVAGTDDMTSGVTPAPDVRAVLTQHLVRHGDGRPGRTAIFELLLPS